MRLEARRDELDALVKEFEFGLKPNTISIVGDVPTSPVKVTVTSQDAENKDMNALNQETLLSKNNSNTKDSIRFCILEGVWITTKMTDVGFVVCYHISIVLIMRSHLLKFCYLDHKYRTRCNKLKHCKHSRFPSNAISSFYIRKHGCAVAHCEPFISRQIPRAIIQQTECDIARG